MAGANSNIQITELDFVNIKTNLIKYLQSQDQFKDYNFAGSAMSTLLDVLSYNTQYNAYYLNMVANEMFLDTALQRSSVVSHAKLLDYTPKTSKASRATINLTVSGGANNVTIVLPRFAEFNSKPINGKTYTFITTDFMSATFNNNVAVFNNVSLVQGKNTTLNFIYNQQSNPKSVFKIPNTNIDSSTLLVQVYPNPSNSYFDVYNLAESYTSLNGESKVYFFEESVDGTYTITFGNGVLGKQISDGSRVSISYLVTQGAAPVGANNFTLSTTIGGYTVTVNPQIAAYGGQDQESIESIKFQAPKSYASQNRAVTKEDYISLVQNNNLGL